LLAVVHNWFKDLVEGSDRQIVSFVMASSHDRSLSVSRDGYLVNYHSRTQIKPLVKDKWISAAAFSDKGDIAISAEGQPSLMSFEFIKYLWSGELKRKTSDEISVFDPSGELISTFPTGATPNRLLFSPDSDNLLSMPEIGPPTIWSLEGKLVATIKTEERIQFARFSPNGNYVLVFPEKGAPSVWSVQGGLAAGITTDEPRLAVFSPNSNYVLTVPQEGAPTVWSVHGQLIATIKTEGHLWYVAFSPDSEFVLAATFDGMLLLWDIPNDQMIRRIKGPKAAAIAIGFRLGGQQIAVVYGEPVQMKVWDVRSGDEVVSEFRWSETLSPINWP
jgi:WD40 repeat protein